MKVLQICGFWTFNINSENGETSTSKFKVFYSFFLLVSYFYLLYLRINNTDAYRQEGSELSKLSMAIFISMSGVFYIVTVVINFINQKAFGAHLKYLQKFDAKVSSSFLIISDIVVIKNLLDVSLLRNFSRECGLNFFMVTKI